ncbi:MAG: hypothetical protein NZZ60_03570 [Bacteroidia bacterium]|nr:hypothetical protein [Bacteroidia bacterium]MCX7652336.1 hypothetical protein [Bacteroidia bacterium]MDW8417552.1 hypothetical protein [Bacteroidia bacterium]
MYLPKWAALLIGLLVAVGGVSLFALHRENQALQEEVKRVTHMIEEHPVELATFMASYERFLSKLHQAGTAQNWALAEFYHEELEETAEQLEKLGLEDDGVPVSAMMRPNLIEPLEAVKKAIDAKNPEQFQQSLSLLITRCNGCHTAAGKPYIQFALPEPQKPIRQVFSQ